MATPSHVQRATWRLLVSGHVPEEIHCPLSIQQMPGRQWAIRSSFPQTTSCTASAKHAVVLPSTTPGYHQACEVQERNWVTERI